MVGHLNLDDWSSYFYHHTALGHITDFEMLTKPHRFSETISFRAGRFCFLCINNLMCMIGYLVRLVYSNRRFFCWYGGDFLEILLRCEPLIITSLALVLRHCASGEQLHNNKRHDYFSYPYHFNFLIMQ
ncbi:hypothetical protein AFERRID_03600 [Acidithiobacillus ferridurans]|uniref:Uncharacterized protein n=1 Tax=Acidithiobacillus ferridurans TaxID=1232575 RepID=A0A2Z6IET7_ACIFI|nr:hypothetical protein AFERRID_03600 [Acidithiobacillus ferridurans]